MFRLARRGHVCYTYVNEIPFVWRIRSPGYVPCDRMNDLIGPRQFGWSANFENPMKARACRARAMKLPVPVKRTSPIEEAFQIVYL